MHHYPKRLAPKFFGYNKYVPQFDISTLAHKVAPRLAYKPFFAYKTARDKSNILGQSCSGTSSVGGYVKKNTQAGKQDTEARQRPPDVQFWV